MDQRQHSLPRATSARRRPPIDLTGSDDEAATRLPRSRPIKSERQQSSDHGNDSDVEYIGSRTRADPNSRVRAPSKDLQRSLRTRLSGQELELVDLTLGSPEADTGRIQRGSYNTTILNAKQRAEASFQQVAPRDGMGWVKSRTPRKSAHQNEASPQYTRSPIRRKRGEVPIPSTDETSMSMEDSSMPDAGLNGLLGNESASMLPSEPMPAPTSSSVREQTLALSMPAEWQAPKVELEYDAIKKVWEKHLREFKEDHIRFTSDQMERARLQHQKAEIANATAQRVVIAETATAQSNPRWYEAPSIITSEVISQGDDNAFIFTVKPSKKGSKPTEMFVEMQPFAPVGITVPHFRTYYPVRRSQLVQSDKDMLFWPEATETTGYDEAKVKQKLVGQFDFRMETRVVEVAYLQLGRQWQPYAESFLNELNLSEEDMLRFLIDDSHDDHIQSLYEKIYPEDKVLDNSDSEDSEPEDIDPVKLLKQMRHDLKASPQAATIASRVKALEANESRFAESKKTKFLYLGLAFWAVASAYRDSQDGPLFNFVYCISQSPTLDIGKYLQDSVNIEKEGQGSTYGPSTHFDFACRICHVYPCFVHGLDSMWDYRPPNQPDAPDEEPRDEQDLHPWRDTLESIHRRARGRRVIQAPHLSEEKPKMDPEFLDYRLYGDTNNQEKTRVFFPCNHEGPCEVGVCRCAAGTHKDTPKDQYLCEKSCGCDASCKLRFKGCRCARKGRTCSDEKCPCVKASRECDPDLCGSCGVYEALDPQNVDHDAAFFRDKCQNCHIQRNVPKRTLIGQSTIHGIGLFAGEDIKKGEYVGEYLGAKLNWKQAERSGLYLLLQKYSYLFDMTGDQTVDAMVLGNKTRFINSIKGRMNLTPKVLVCNTEHRMGLYATCNITAGQELSFHYGDAFFEDHDKKDKGKGRRGGAHKAVGVKAKRATGAKRRPRKIVKSRQVLPAVVRNEIPAVVRSRSDGMALVKAVAEAMQSDTADTGSEGEAMQMDRDDLQDDDFEEGEEEDEEEDGERLVIEESSAEESEQSGRITRQRSTRGLVRR